ncbi:MAG: T9SS type A sorting domain-containing protein [candidate division WOR-3 bacterium]|nr:MAG: T9SS type A sorting domain-containing protein [candidate division WOR-3 bacterium]
MKKLLALSLLIVFVWAIPLDRYYIDEGTTSDLPHMPLPDFQGLALVDSSGNLYSGLFIGQDGIDYNTTLGYLEFLNRGYSPTGDLYVHQTDNVFTFWTHDLAYEATTLGNARYPSSLASENGPHIGMPLLDQVTGTWGHMGGQFDAGGWFSGFWDPAIDMSGDIGSQCCVPKALPNGDIVFVADVTDGTVQYYTYSNDLGTENASGNFGTYDFIAVDVNGGICRVFLLDGALDVYYFSSTDGVTWTGPTLWDITWPNPYTNNTIWVAQMALTDAGDPIFVFEIRDSDDAVWPVNAKSYVQTASGATPTQISDDVYDAGRLPFVATGGGTIVVFWLAHTNAEEESLARWDGFFSNSTDGGATWSSPLNITSGITDRPCLTQIAKRIDATNGNFFYVLGTPILFDIDLEWADFTGNDHRLEPVRWWVGWHPTTGVAENKTEKPGHTSLAFAPNPASHRAAVSYTLSKAGNISLRIFDLAGREVQTVERGYRDAGVYSVNVDTRNLTNGTYFFVLDTPDGNISRPLVVVH